MDIGEGREEWTMPAKLKVVREGEVSRVRLTLQEGKYHQVKRMFRAVGMEVLYLRREVFGTLTLDESLSLGDFRKLTEEELELLL